MNLFLLYKYPVKKYRIKGKNIPKKISFFYKFALCINL